MSAQTTHGPEIRTYRGRNLEELIPRIREELGPDAIILREREGLTGGINGFFAQRCVEVDVQAPGGPVPPGIDFYDEEHDALPGASDPWAERAPAPAASTFAEPAAEPESAPVEFPEPEPEPATSAFAEPEREPQPAPVEFAEPEPAPVAFAEPEPERVAAPQPAAEPEPASATPLEALTFAERLAQARREHDAALGAAPQAPAERSVADELAALAAPSSSAATTPAPAPAARRPTPTPYPTGVRGKVRVRPKTARPAAATAAAATASAATAAATTAAPAAATRRRTGTPGPGAQLDPVAAGAVARELIARGISEAWAHELIVSASAHLTPFAQHGSLRDAVRAGMAAGIAAPPLLPSSGAAVAFVGAGGAGKSRCAAAMAAAYARASTLRVSVLSLADGTAGALLSGRGVEVQAPGDGETLAAVARGRERGLVVIDAPPTSPVDSAAVGALAARLAPLGLDSVYLTLPATLSASAAHGLIDGLGELGPTALAITHADETGELGIAAELAYQTGLPVAFIHEGTALEAALRPADPLLVASRVLP